MLSSADIIHAALPMGIMSKVALEKMISVLFANIALEKCHKRKQWRRSFLIVVSVNRSINFVFFNKKPSK